nr:MAG TPA: hypothetical protein [Caudoviricetes sp.]DAP16968.1 MAG TPA: hypothetical protein [Caudoviricetes sp.]DAP43027.1 MAG TPA: hypothetical protein [Caudoviricetes sp.]
MVLPPTIMGELTCFTAMRKLIREHSTAGKR